jgi:ribosome-binding protein aMBF1 (putative translation factor)
MFVMGMTPFDLCRETGIDQSRISYIEGGYISPREDEKQKIEDVIGIKICWYDFRRK